jgi:type IV pilus assembly protein PilC
MKKQRGLSNTYLSVFCTELSMVLQAGISLSEGVYLLLEEEPDPDGKKVLKGLLNPLEDGKPLSEALKASGLFPEYMVSMTEAGERTGRLSETLKGLSAHYERMERVAVSVKNAVLYPGVMLVMMIAVVMILVIAVLPIFNDVFARLGRQMSPLAASLMELGDWMIGASAVIAAVFGALFLAALFIWAVPALKKGVMSLFRNTFGNRGVFLETALSRFTSAMAMSLASGLDTQDAVNMAATVGGGSKGLTRKYDLCLEKLRAGAALPEALRDASIISTRDSRFLTLGGASGMADAAMADIARRSELHVQDRIESVVGRIEPTLIIVTSVIVGVVLLSVMLPLMGIMTSLG